MIINFLRTYKFSILFLFIITFLMLIPGKSIPDELVIFNGVDFVVHILLFGFLTVLYLFEKSKDRSAFLTITAFIITIVVYSFIIEIVQHFFIPGRTGSYFDFSANITGLSLLFLKKFFPAKS
jgi:VanZ family protein